MAATAADNLLPPENDAYPGISPVESVESLEASLTTHKTSSPIKSTLQDTSTRDKLQVTGATSETASKNVIDKKSAPTPSPGRRRPRPPTKGILKPPPPPAKASLGNRLRDLAANVVGPTPKGLFDPDDAGPSSRPLELPASGAAVTAVVGDTLNALGGKLGFGFSRLVGGNLGTGAQTPSPVNTPTGSPLTSRVALPDIGGSGGVVLSEKARQKQPLKRATFVLPSLSITYPISSHGEPWSAKVLEDRKKIESSHKSQLSASTGAEYWTSQRLVKLYETACKGREERPRPGILEALNAIPPHPRARSIHLQFRPIDPSQSSSSSPYAIDIPLHRHAAEALADVLSSEWGLSDLRLEGGMIEDELALKPILHALLVSGTLPSLSLAANRKIRDRGWRLLAVFLKKARSLRYVDLSDTYWDPRSIGYLVQALTSSPIRPHQTSTPISSPSKGASSPLPTYLPSKVTSLLFEAPPDEDMLLEKDSSIEEPKVHIEHQEEVEEAIVEEKDYYSSFIPPAPLLRDEELETRAATVQTLRMDGCGLKANLLEPLASGVRSSDIKNISLRRNRIGPLGAVALAVMIRDYPDSTHSTSTLSPNGAIPFQYHSHQSSHLSPDQSHSPYKPRRRPQSQILNGSPRSNPQTENDDNLPPIPLVISNSPGITSRSIPEGYKPPIPPKHPLVMPSGGTQMQDMAVNATYANVEGKMTGMEAGGASFALQRQVRALDGVQRIGRLLTLDLKGNEIKNGVSYIAQVLKRNRTLKVLNLSDNRIEPAGLASLAEALKYNSTLETLDLSSNPCCSPTSEGVTALRTAFTVNTALKRLFLSDTGLNSEGAIALAEFLPETKSLLHLDLTANPIDTAGILAISSGLKANLTIRCLDLSIPPNNPDLAELSQTILQYCIRNTEAAINDSGKGGEAIWGPIKKSVLVRQAKEAEDYRAQQERVEVASSVEGKAREYIYHLVPDKLISVGMKTGMDVEKWLKAGKAYNEPNFKCWEPGQLPKEEYRSLIEKAKALRERLVDEINNNRIGDDTVMARALELNDSLGNILKDGKGFIPPPRLLLPSQIVPISHSTRNGGETSIGIGPAPPTTAQGLPSRQRRHMRGTSLEISSPNFSIGDSDNDSDAEELDIGKIPNQPQPPLYPSSYPSKSSSSHRRNGNAVKTKLDERLDLRELSDLKLEAGDDLEEALREAASSSPVEKVGKAWIEEEGEIFRKGTKLGVADDEEVAEHGDISGEDLKQEILETEVARSPTRRKISVEEEENEAQDAAS